MEPVSYEIALKAKEKGFNEPCIYWTDTITKELGDSTSYEVPNYKKYPNSIAVPIQSELHKWLRDKYNCFVFIVAEPYISGINWNVQVLFYDKTTIDLWGDNSSGMYGDNGEFKTYEEALNFGLLEALCRI